jgi:hypothetical protein
MRYLEQQTTRTGLTTPKFFFEANSLNQLRGRFQITK